MAFGEGASLVEGEVAGLGEALQGFAILDQDAKLGGSANADRERGGDGETHRAGAGDDQDRDGGGEGAGEGMIDRDPGDEGEHREAQDDGHEDGGGAVGELLHGSSAGLGFGEQAAELGEDRGCAEGRGFDGERAVEVDGAADDLGLRLLEDGGGLAGKERFVDTGGAGEDEAVDGDALAGAQQNVVAGMEFGDGEFGFDTVAEDAGGGRDKLGEGGEGGLRAALGASVQPGAQQEEGEDEVDRFEVHVGGEAVREEDVWREGRRGGPGEGGKSADRDQGAHVRRAVACRCEGAAVGFGAENSHHRDREDEQEPARGRCGEMQVGHPGHEKGGETAGVLGHERHGEEHGGGRGSQSEKSAQGEMRLGHVHIGGGHLRHASHVAGAWQRGAVAGVLDRLD
jgi:hypothetical protein